MDNSGTGSDPTRMCGTTRNLEKEFGDINNLQYAAMPCLQDNRLNAAMQHKNEKV
jgi:hypothetical protein